MNSLDELIRRRAQQKLATVPMPEIQSPLTGDEGMMKTYPDLTGDGEMEIAPLQPSDPSEEVLKQLLKKRMEGQ